MKTAYVCLLVGTALAVTASATCPNTLTKAEFSWVGDPSHIFTAAVVNPTGPLSGDVDATGCDIGVYYSSTGGSHWGDGGDGGRGVNGASIHDAKYFGVVNNGANVDVTNSTVYDIGDDPLGGNQYGIGIYFAFQSNAQGSIKGNTIWDYQLAGIVVSGPKAGGDVTNNTIVGSGPIGFNAQAGIQVGFGANSDVKQNIVVGNSYNGVAVEVGVGIQVVGGSCFGGAFQTGSSVDYNVLVGNDVGIYLVNEDATCNAPTTTKTNNEASQNTVRNNAYPPNNTEAGGYQSGITDIGNFDTIQHNAICGAGYTGATVLWPYLLTIDTNFANIATVKNNTTCNATSPVTSVKNPPHHKHWIQ